MSTLVGLVLMILMMMLRVLRIRGMRSGVRVLLSMVRKTGRAERRLIDGSTVLSFMRLSEVMLNQKLVLELLMGARLLVRLRGAGVLSVPRRSAMDLGISDRRIAHHLLSTSACCGRREPGSLRSLPDAMLHRRHTGRNGVTVRLSVIQVCLPRWVDEGIDGRASRGCCSKVGLLLMVWIEIHGEARFGMTKGAHGGRSIMVERHG